MGDELFPRRTVVAGETAPGVCAKTSRSYALV